MKILGIGNAIVDVICKIDNNFLDQNNLTKSTMKLVDETEFKKGLTVHPNPVKDNINISFYSISELTNPLLELYDATGRLVNSNKLNHLVSGANEIEMSSSNLDAGWYLLVLKSQEKTITNKFLKN